MAGGGIAGDDGPAHPPRRHQGALELLRRRHAGQERLDAGIELGLERRGRGPGIVGRGGALGGAQRQHGDQFRRVLRIGGDVVDRRVLAAHLLGMPGKIGGGHADGDGRGGARDASAVELLKPEGKAGDGGSAGGEPGIECRRHQPEKGGAVMEQAAAPAERPRDQHDERRRRDDRRRAQQP
jgi:hypothetical protein